MSYAERHSVAVTTAADGTATAYSPAITGRVVSISYVKTDFADGVDFTITAEATGQSLWTDTNINAAETVYPVQPANLGASGAASTLTEVSIVLANDRVKIVIAQGGNAKTGAFLIVVT
jgi:hypothetical protein